MTLDAPKTCSILLIFIGSVSIFVKEGIFMNDKLTTLTAKQKEAYLAIEAFIAENKIPPTVRELGEILGEKTPGAVQGIINRLAEKGVIQKELGVARSIKLVESNSMYLKVIYVPELRRINKRNLHDFLTIYNIVAYHPVSADIFGEVASESFFLDCPDNSLTKSHLQYGDTLMIHCTKEFQNKDIVLMFYENHLLLRYYFECPEDKDKVILKADSNLLNKEVFDRDEVVLIGKLVSKIQIF